MELMQFVQCSYLASNKIYKNVFCSIDGSEELFYKSSITLFTSPKLLDIIDVYQRAYGGRQFQPLTRLDWRKIDTFSVVSRTSKNQYIPKKCASTRLQYKQGKYDEFSEIYEALCDPKPHIPALLVHNVMVNVALLHEQYNNEIDTDFIFVMYSYVKITYNKLVETVRHPDM